MGRRAMVLLAWVLSTALAAGVAWTAVAAVGRGSGEGDQVLSEAQVAAALEARQSAAASAGPTASPSARPTSPGPTPSSSPTADPTSPGPTQAPTSAPTTTPPAGPEAVESTWPVDGGLLNVSCTGAAIAFGYATANDGWAYEVKNRGPEQVEVEFDADGTETKVRAVCVGGVPQMSSEAGDSHDGDRSGGDDARSDD